MKVQRQKKKNGGREKRRPEARALKCYSFSARSEEVFVFHVRIEKFNFQVMNRD